MAEPGPLDRPRSAATAGPPRPASGDAAGVTRGFLFADLRDYTGYVETHGNRAGAALLERYRALVREVVAGAQGAEIRTEGDSFYVVFGSVSAAVGCGLAIIEAAAATTAHPDPIKVGVGVHAGETVETAEGFVGSAVNIAARLCAEAKSGEVVVSETVRGLTRTQIEVEFQPLGSRRLKGVPEPLACYRVVPRGTVSAGAAPPRRTAGVPRTRLLAASLAAAVVLAVGAGTLILGGSRAAPTASPAASPAAGAVDVTPAASRSLGPSPSTSPAPIASPTPGPFPTGAEAAILAALPAGPVGVCRRGGTADDARLAGFVGNFYYSQGFPYQAITPDHVLAGLTCRPAAGAARLYVVEIGLPRGWYALAEIQTYGDTYLGFLEGHWKIPPGSCATDKRAYETWSGPSGSGQLACVNPYDGRPWIYFTFDKGRYLAFATRDDSDYAALYAWWGQLKTFLP
jgi:class 3 adenylate cyclase